jgi:hypothetical protein
VWEWRLTLLSEFPFWELESRWTPKPSENDWKGQNTLHWKVFYIIEKILKCRCLKWVCMTHLDIYNTSYGKKKGQESKLAIWLLTTKSRESTQLPCVQVACNMPLDHSQWELQLCFKLHPDQKSKHEVIAPQSCGNSNLGSFKCYNPTFVKVWGWHSHSRNGDLGVLRDSWNFRVRLQGSKHLALKRPSCHCKKYWSVDVENGLA